jgi:hypothetical protein
MINLDSIKTCVRTPKVLLPFLFLFLVSCTYRFTNIATDRPAGIESIAVAAVYDTTSEIIPHDIFWTAMQKAVIDNGRLRLTSEDKADALLRSHIKSASFRSKDAAPTSGKQPKILPNTNILGKDIDPMTQSEAASTEEILVILVDVEVWDLKTRSKIFSKTYSSGNRIVDRSYDARSVAMDGQFLVYTESVNTMLADVAADMSANIISDLFLQQL